MAFKEYDHKPSFLEVELSNIIGKSRTQKFLSEVDLYIDWKLLESIVTIVTSNYPVGQSDYGNKAYPPLMLLKATLLHNRFDIATCPYIRNQTGYTKHMYVKEHPRLVNEIPRSPKRFQTIKKLRSASERSNSTMKEDLKILANPKVLSKVRADILAHMAVIVLLFKRAFSFIVKITILFRKFHKTHDPAVRKNCNLLPSLNPY